MRWTCGVVWCGAVSTIMQVLYWTSMVKTIESEGKALA